MVTQSSSDVLFDIITGFYIGNYQFCINESQKAKLSNPVHMVTKDVYMYRSYIAQKKFGVVLNDISSASAPELQNVRMLAEYMSADENKKREIVLGLDEQLKSFDPENRMFPLMAAYIYFLEEDYNSVLRILYQKTDHLENSALTIQTYLAINRVDLAMKELQAMKDIDEDSTLTQLCQAWVGLSKNGEKLQEAYYIFQELSEKYTHSPMLLNGIAAALLSIGRYEEAESVLQEALDKDPNCPETLLNMIVLSQHLSKSTEVSVRYFNQLKDSHSDHPFVKDYQNKEQEFDRIAKSYYPSVA